MVMNENFLAVLRTRIDQHLNKDGSYLGCGFDSAASNNAVEETRVTE
jgi:hypothetical protein